MKNAWRVVVLDYRSYRTPIATYIVYFVLMAGLCYSDSSLSPAIATYVFLVLDVPKIFERQRLTGMVRLYGTLPLSRQDFIRGRYFYIWLCIITIWLFYICANFIGNLFRPTPIHISELIALFAVSYLIFCLGMMLIAPNYFLYGKGAKHSDDTFGLGVLQMICLIPLYLLYLTIAQLSIIPSLLACLCCFAAGTGLLFSACESTQKMLFDLIVNSDDGTK